MLNGFPWPLTGSHSKDPRNIDYAPSLFAFAKPSAKTLEDQHKRYTRAVQRSKRKLPDPSITICKKSKHQTHNGNEDSVEIGDEEEADDSTNENLTRAEEVEEKEDTTVGVEKIVADDDVDVGDDYSPWSHVSDIDFGSMDSENGSIDHDNEEMEKFLEETYDEVEHDNVGSEEEQMESTNSEDEIVDNSREMSHLQKELEESEYEVAKLQLDSDLLLHDKSDLRKEVASLRVQLERLHHHSLKLMQCNAQLLTMTFQASCLENDDSRMTFYTGLPSFEVFRMLCAMLEPLSKRSFVSKCPPENQLLLVLSKLRLGLSNRDLSYRMHLSEAAVSTIFHNWIDLMYCEMKQLITWPDHETLRKNLPKIFQGRFSRTICIIDCFEVFIERPCGFHARAATYSNYKKHNTIKVLIAIAPTGCVSFISKAWGGRASDRHITQHSGFLDNLMHGDLVLADRGFNIHDELAVHGARLEVPAYTKGKKQLSREDVERTRYLARVRIHVERVIGLIKNKYKLLQGTLPISLVERRSDKDITTIDKIITVTAALTNLCKPVL